MSYTLVFQRSSIFSQQFVIQTFININVSEKLDEFNFFSSFTFKILINKDDNMNSYNE